MLEVVDTEGMHLMTESNSESDRTSPRASTLRGRFFDQLRQPSSKAVIVGVSISILGAPASILLGWIPSPFEDKEASLQIAVLESGTIGPAWVIPTEYSSRLDRSGELGRNSQVISQWEKKGQATPAGTQVLRVAFQGSTGKSIIIYSMEVDADCGPPERGLLYQEGGGGTASPRHFEVTLDAAGGPKVEPYKEIKGGRIDGSEKTSFPYTVSESDVEFFEIDATTRQSSCKWQGKVHWTVGGKVHDSVISDNGKPFLLTSSSGLGLWGEP
ncbi:hypothetical protein ACFC09_10860 [Streptomyces sp. NPDC056161]|uniref:hypothetical protein n=1 Tax=Streptomyces sp. NPDC056161 TaxID=3345732 RepID=UPI0035E37A31